MKRNKILGLVVLLFSFAFGQSDLEYVTSFEKQIDQFNQSIEVVTDNLSLSRLEVEIANYKDKNVSHSELISQSLYPKTYKSIFDELSKNLYAKREVLAKEVQYEENIETLQTEISELKQQLDELSNSYMSKLNEIEGLKKSARKNSQNQSQLNRKIRELQSNLIERERVIYSLLDSILFVQARINPNESLETGGGVLKIINFNYLKQLEILVNDNRQYLKNVELPAEELIRIYKESKDLSKNLSKLDNSTIEFLQKKSVDSSEYQNLKYEVSAWQFEIQRQLTSMMGKVFREQGIMLEDNNSVEVFFDSMIDFLEKESVRAGDKDSLIMTYHSFVDSAWNDVNDDYLSLLLEANLVNKDKIDTVDDLISEWEKRLDQGKPIYLYVGIGLVFVIIILFVFSQIKKSKFKQNIKDQIRNEEYEKQKALDNQE